MIEFLPNGNAMNDDGDVVPISNVIQDAGAEMQPLEPRNRKGDLMIGSYATHSLVEEIRTSEDELPVEHEWHSEINVWNNFGLSRYTPADYHTLPSHDYDTWQRVVRNYACVLENRFKRIRHKEGKTEYDFELGKLYGNRTPQELLEYASELEELHGMLVSGAVIDPAFDVLTKQKRKNAPHYRDIAILRNDANKLELIVLGKQKGSA